MEISSEEQPLVSIVIPVYNGSNFMREAIDSALAQTYPNIEILVVNDGSTDNTREIALSYGDRIRYFEKENGGVATALNLALRNMKGIYFSWLSHDDWYEPDKVEEEIKALRASGNMNQAVYSDCDIVSYPSGNIRPLKKRRFGKQLAETGWFAAIMGLFDGCDLLIPKSYFDEFGGFDEGIRAANDYEQWFRMFRDKTVLHVEKNLVHFRKHERQVTYTYKGLAKEADWFYTWAIRQLQQMNMEESSVSLYEVFSMLLSDVSLMGGMDETKNLLIGYLKTTEEPWTAESARMKLAKKVRAESDEVYVYCAGRIAKRFLKDMRWRGIALNGVSDSNPAIWGKDVEGMRCLSPTEIPKDARIIVANAYPNAIVTQLRRKGFANAVALDDVWDYDLLKAPIKKECCEVLQ